MSQYTGYLIGFGAMMCYASLAPIAKKITQDGLTAYSLIFINSVLLTAFSLAAILIAKDTNLLTLKNIDITSWVRITLWSLVNFIGFALYIWAIAKIPVTDYQIMYLATPLIGGVLAYFLVNEALEFKHLIGGAFVAVGIYITIKM
jgi:drug/metabolite transporter (DMT)-like permease